MLGTSWTGAAALGAALVIAVLATPAGISGAVLLLPFQVSVLGTPSPAVTPTNLLYNVVATPGPLYRLPDRVIRRVMGVLVVAIGARYLWSGLG
jgi:uncharacterized membrane protein YfcA